MLFQYTHVPRNAIRLLTFAPSSTPADISLNLHHQERYSDSSIKYNVLLYSPDLQLSKPLTLHGRTRLAPAPVWAALSAILQQHRSFVGTPLWIESLCVNQRDEAEVAGQRVEVPQIYTCAEQLLVWCGCSGENAETAFEALVVMEKEQGGEKETSRKLGDLTDESRVALQNLLQTVQSVPGMSEVPAERSLTLLWENSQITVGRSTLRGIARTLISNSGADGKNEKPSL